MRRACFLEWQETVPGTILDIIEGSSIDTTPLLHRNVGANVNNRERPSRKEGRLCVDGWEFEEGGLVASRFSREGFGATWDLMVGVWIVSICEGRVRTTVGGLVVGDGDLWVVWGKSWLTPKRNVVKMPTKVAAGDSAEEERNRECQTWRLCCDVEG